MKVDPGSGCHVGKRGMFVQKQDQVSALAEIGRGGSSCRDSLGLGEELIREGRAIEWNRARHETAPRTTDEAVHCDTALTLSPPRNSATLQLFGEWTT